MLKVVEDELVVGIITETNQFIQISEPINPETVELKYKLPVLTNNAHYMINKKENIDEYIETTDTIDTERINYIDKIKKETMFYNVFRNM